MPTSQLVIGGLIYSDPRREGLQKVMDQLHEGETYYIFGGIFKITRDSIEQIISSSSIPNRIISNNLLYACTDQEFAEQLARYNLGIRNLIYVKKKNINQLYERLSIQDNPYDRMAIVKEYENKESFPQKIYYVLRVTEKLIYNQITSAYQERDGNVQPQHR